MTQFIIDGETVELDSQTFVIGTRSYELPIMNLATTRFASKTFLPLLQAKPQDQDAVLGALIDTIVTRASSVQGLEKLTSTFINDQLVGEEVTGFLDTGTSWMKKSRFLKDAPASGDGTTNAGEDQPVPAQVPPATQTDSTTQLS